LHCCIQMVPEELLGSGKLRPAAAERLLRWSSSWLLRNLALGPQEWPNQLPVQHKLASAHPVTSDRTTTVESVLILPGLVAVKSPQIHRPFGRSQEKDRQGKARFP